MQGLCILIFQICIIILYGIFVRTGSTTVDYSTIQTPLYFCIAFTLYSLKYRMFDWTQLTNFLFIFAITFQLNTLLIMFWHAAFNNSFSGTTEISSYHLLVNVQCLLAVLVTVFQFTGKISLQQIFVLCLVEIFGFTLNFFISICGIKAITGGGTINIFLFGFLFALPIRIWCCVQQLQNETMMKERYLTKMLKLIGMIVMIILWGSFSSATAEIDVIYLNRLYGTILSTNVLTAQAFLHMHLGFMAAVGTTMALMVKGQKIVLNQVINTLFLSGVFLSSSAQVIIDPFASLLMGVSAPVLVFIMDSLLQNVLPKGYNLEGIIMAGLGGIFQCIFTSGRNSRSPALSDNAPRQGGLQLASLIVTACLAFAFGLLATLILRCFSPRQSTYKDNTLWFIDQQTLPIYPDDQILKKIVGQRQEAQLRHENVVFNLKDSYLTQNKDQQASQRGKIIKKQIDLTSRIM